MYYLKVFKALNKHKVNYLTIGGIAVNLYGLSRLTLDLDLMLELKKDNFDKLFEAMKELKFQLVKTFDKRSLIFTDDGIKLKNWPGAAIIFYNPKDEFERVDVFLKNPIDFQAAFKQREDRTVKGVKVPLISFEDLLKMKDLAGREKDWKDIGYLKKLRELDKEEHDKT